jgi:hypothetical protein
MNRQDSATWNGKHDKLATLLAQGRGIKDAATAIGVGERTAHRWLKDTQFRTYVAELRERMLDATIGRLIDASTKAVDTLVRLLDDAKEVVRVRAALGILDSMTRMREHAEFDRRLSNLEAEHAVQPEIEDVSD